MDDKIFCGSGRIIESKFGQIPKISLSKDDINKIVQHMKTNNLEWVNLEMKQKKEAQQGKPTHYLQIDTWKPSESKPASAPVDESDLPF